MNEENYKEIEQKSLKFLVKVFQPSKCMLSGVHFWLSFKHTSSSCHHFHSKWPSNSQTAHLEKLDHVLRSIVSTETDES